METFLHRKRYKQVGLITKHKSTRLNYKNARIIVLAEYIYEGLFILNSNRYGRDPEGVAGSIQSLIEKQDGTVLVLSLIHI